MFEDYLFSEINEESEFMPLLSITEDEEVEGLGYPDSLPLLALKNTVLFPGVVIPITIGREKSVNAVNAAHQENKFIAVFSQKDIAEEDWQGGVRDVPRSPNTYMV